MLFASMILLNFVYVLSPVFAVRAVAYGIGIVITILICVISEEYIELTQGLRNGDLTIKAIFVLLMFMEILIITCPSILYRIILFAGKTFAQIKVFEILENGDE